MNRLIKIFTGVFLFSLINSCSPAPQPKACTELGCYSGLYINLKGDRPMEFKIIIKSSGKELATKECSTSKQCPDSILFQDLKEKSLTLEYTSNGQTRSENFTVAYQTVRPNGTQCPPVCEQANVDFKL